MKRAAVMLPLLAAMAIASRPAAAQGPLDGAWELRVRDLHHHEKSAAIIRFTDEAAPSCIGGDWKRVAVESVRASDDRFFPLSQPLSYTIEGPELAIGRNEVCDGYLRLRGKLVGGKVNGTYEAFGKGGGEPLGDFTLERAR